MQATDKYRESIQAFGRRYRYDMSYQLDLLDAAPEAFETFARAQGTSSHRRALPLDAHYVARLAMMQAEDCGDCVAINLRMALEAGVERELLRTLLERPHELSASLRDVRDHAFDVSAKPKPDAARVARLQAALGHDGFAELSVCLAGCRLFTTVKRSLLKARPYAASDAGVLDH